MSQAWSEPRGLLVRIVRWYSRRKFGDVLNPMEVMAHNSKVFKAYLSLERAAQRWKSLEPRLGHLAVMAAAAEIGCAWCMDFSYWVSEDHGVTLEKARAVPHWREATCFDELERMVLEYSQAMTATPVQMDDGLVGRLRRHLTEEQLVELTATVALENWRARVNAAHGLASQGFSDRCEIPRDPVAA